MTKEDLIKQANDWANDFWDESNLDPEERSDPSAIELAKASGACGYIAGAEAAMPKWISVKEGLPTDPMLNYLCWDDSREDICICCIQPSGKFQVDTNFINGRDYDGDDVRITHWMPLPAEPEEVL